MKAELDFDEKFKRSGESLMVVICDFITDEETATAMEYLSVASDTALPEKRHKYDMKLGRLIRELVERMIEPEEEPKSDEPYEEMYGNHAYDAIAKDRAGGYK